jgi:DNA-binding transcriptional ArsR family regulator
MAIPGRLWPDDSFGGDTEGSPDESFAVSQIETATDVFGILSNATRLEILASLYDRSEPIPYTELRESISITDKGQFNYHLRQLDQFVQGQDGRYTLTERGEKLVEEILSEDQILRYE